MLVSPYTPDTARDEAVRLLGEVVGKNDPAAEKIATRKAATVSELCDLYLADAEAGRLLTRRKAAKKASTLATDRGRIERHIKPQLGRLAVASVIREEVDGFLHDVAEGKTTTRVKTAKKRGVARVSGGKATASRTVGLLGAIFAYAVRHRVRPDNPVHGVTRFADGRLMLTVLGGLAEFEHELIHVRTGEGRARAAARGVKIGRKPKLTAHQKREASKRRDQGEPVREIAHSYNVGHSTIPRLSA